MDKLRELIKAVLDIVLMAKEIKKENIKEFNDDELIKYCFMLSDILFYEDISLIKKDLIKELKEDYDLCEDLMDERAIIPKC